MAFKVCHLFPPKVIGWSEEKKPLGIKIKLLDFDIDLKDGASAQWVKFHLDFRVTIKWSFHEGMFFF